jgi:hypothetical protein
LFDFFLCPKQAEVKIAGHAFLNFRRFQAGQVARAR